MGCLKRLKTAFVGLLMGAVVVSTAVQAFEAAPAAGLPSIPVTELIRQGAITYRLIHQGGPFAHEKDGVVFANRERLLPLKTRGYYHEYTVATPGARDRGARRIVCGGQLRTPDICYYTDDHYASFRKIVR